MPLTPPATVSVTDEGCWLLPVKAATEEGGYARVYVGAHVSGHHLMYRALVGPVQRGLQLHHTCENPPCCNPEHLEPLTPEEHRQRHLIHRTHCVNGHPIEEHGYRDTAGALRCRICRAATVKKAKQQTKAQRPYACARCGWSGLGSDLVDDRCPSCSVHSGRWGPQHATTPGGQPVQDVMRALEESITAAKAARDAGR